MVEVLTNNIIRVYTETDNFINVIFVVHSTQVQKAVKVLTKAYEKFWEDQDDWPVMSWFESALV